MSRLDSVALEVPPFHRQRRSLAEQSHKCTTKVAWSTELHGLTQLIYSTLWLERIFWALLILVCLVLAVSTNRILLSDYVAQNTRTFYSVEKTDFLRFPNITACPATPDVLDFEGIKQDFKSRVGNISKAELQDLMMFTMGGAGFRYAEKFTGNWNESHLTHITALFRQWQGNRTLSNLFKHVFEDHGVKCEKFFNYCILGGARIRCCEVFRPTYVALRGRCFRLRRLYQEDFGNAGALSIGFNQISSPYFSTTGMQNQIVLYVSDKYPDVRLFPRFYLNRERYMVMHLQAVVYKLLPTNEHCSASPEDQGQGTCPINSWLRTRIIGPHNCTLFYMHHKNPELEICRPEVVISDYYNVTGTSRELGTFGRTSKLSDAQCLPACNRKEVRVTIRDDRQKPRWWTEAPFSLELTYESMEMEYYTEVVTTTLSGFIAEIGGQYSLWLGISSTGIVQFILSISYGIYYVVFKWKLGRRKLFSNREI